MADWYEIFPRIFNMSLTAGIIILVVLAVRLLLQKSPRIFSYALWGVVLFRLLCPLSVSSSLSVLNLTDTPIAENGALAYVPPDIVYTAYQTVHLPMSGVNEEINEALPRGEEQTGADPLEFPVSALTYIWLPGMVGMLLYSAVRWLRLKQQVECSIKFRDNIYLADYISTPFVLGLLRPRIYIPSTVGEYEREYIILHEQHHIRRLDHFVKLLAFLALCLHWFNPLVWLAFLLAGKDMEMSCDEAVMRKMNDDIRADYSASLLHLATGRKIIFASPLAFGEGNPKSRIKNIMNYKKPTLLLSVISVMLCGIVAVALLTNPVEKEQENSSNLTPVQMDGESHTKNGGSTDEKQGTEIPDAGENVEQMITEQQGELMLPDSETHSIEEAIQAAILEKNRTDSPDEFECVDFIVLANERSDSADTQKAEEITYYGWALYQGFNITDKGIEEVNGSHLPLALIFRMTEDGYKLKEYWQPRDGSYFAEDVRDKFPKTVADAALDSQAYIYPQKMNCYAQTIAASKISVFPIIGRHLDEICMAEAARTSSNPQDYINESPIAYRELIYYGEFTLAYREKFAEELGGLRKVILDRACEEIEKVIETGLYAGVEEVYGELLYLGTESTETGKGISEVAADELGQKIFETLEGLEYRDETCDGIAEVSLTDESGTTYQINLTEGWVWKDKKQEADLPEDFLADIQMYLMLK